MVLLIYRAGSRRHKAFLSMERPTLWSTSSDFALYPQRRWGVDQIIAERIGSTGVSDKFIPATKKQLLEVADEVYRFLIKGDVESFKSMYDILPSLEHDKILREANTFLKELDFITAEIPEDQFCCYLCG